MNNKDIYQNIIFVSWFSKDVLISKVSSIGDMITVDCYFVFMIQEPITINRPCEYYKGSFTRVVTVVLSRDQMSTLMYHCHWLKASRDV